MVFLWNEPKQSKTGKSRLINREKKEFGWERKCLTPIGNEESNFKNIDVH